VPYVIKNIQLEVKHLTTKDQALGGLICTICLTIAIAYTTALFWPALEAIRLWLIAIPVFIAFTAVLGIGAWIGWTMATTPLPKPIENIQVEETEEQKE
jgi:predicted DNA-binding transcriptional regulator